MADEKETKSSGGAKSVADQLREAHESVEAVKSFVASLGVIPGFNVAYTMFWVFLSTVVFVAVALFDRQTANTAFNNLTLWSTELFQLIGIGVKVAGGVVDRIITTIEKAWKDVYSTIRRLVFWTLFATGILVLGTIVGFAVDWTRLIIFCLIFLGLMPFVVSWMLYLILGSIIATDAVNLSEEKKVLREIFVAAMRPFALLSFLIFLAGATILVTPEMESSTRLLLLLTAFICIAFSLFTGKVNVGFYRAMLVVYVCFAIWTMGLSKVTFVKQTTDVVGDAWNNVVSNLDVKNNSAYYTSTLNDAKVYSTAQIASATAFKEAGSDAEVVLRGTMLSIYETGSVEVERVPGKWLRFQVVGDRQEVRYIHQEDVAPAGYYERVIDASGTVSLRIPTPKPTATPASVSAQPAVLASQHIPQTMIVAEPTPVSYPEWAYMAQVVTVTTEWQTTNVVFMPGDICRIKGFKNRRHAERIRIRFGVNPDLPLKASGIMDGEWYVDVKIGGTNTEFRPVSIRVLEGDPEEVILERYEAGQRRW